MIVFHENCHALSVRKIPSKSFYPIFLGYWHYSYAKYVTKNKSSTQSLYTCYFEKKKKNCDLSVE